MGRALRAVTCAAALALLAGTAGADEPAPEANAAAQRLFDEAMVLMDAGKYTEACAKFEESQRIDAGMATQFRLAQCYEKAQRVASAWRNYQAVAVAARAAGLADREKYAQERADALLRQVARVAVQVPPEVAALAGLAVSIDGVAIGAADWGGVPVDRGSHLVLCVATGKRRWEQAIEVTEDGTRLTVHVPVLEEAPLEPEPVAPVPVPGSDGADQAEPGGLGPVSIAGIVLTVVGAAGLGTGIGLGVAGKMHHGDADEFCQDQFCQPEGITIRDEARQLGDIGTGVFIGGAAVAVAGVLMWVLGPPATDEAAWHLTPSLGGGVLSSRW
jgi:hypothetical protein